MDEINYHKKHISNVKVYTEIKKEFVNPLKHILVKKSPIYPGATRYTRLCLSYKREPYMMRLYSQVK